MGYIYIVVKSCKIHRATKGVCEGSESYANGPNLSSSKPAGVRQSPSIRFAPFLKGPLRPSPPFVFPFVSLTPRLTFHLISLFSILKTKNI